MNKIFTLWLAMMMAANLILAQDAQIKGIILDSDSKDPLPGATVRVDKTKGGLSDASGKFTVTAPAGEHDLSISYIGYKTEKRHITLKAGEKLQLEILLVSSSLQLNQVVTVSQYGKNSAKETVTVDVIDKEQIQNTNSRDLFEAVSKTPGVLVQDGQISIRGGSTYSYGVGTRTAVLVDGVSTVSPDLQQIQGGLVPIENIKQIEVVKGASSVVYGSAALDGVVNIITGWPTDNDPKTEIETNVGVYDQPKLLYQEWWHSAPPFFGSVNVNHQRRIKNIQLICGGNITFTNSYIEDNNNYSARAFFKLRYLHPKIAGLTLGVNGSLELDRIDQFFISKDIDTNALVPADYSSSKYNYLTVDPNLSYSTIKGHRYKLNMHYMLIDREGNSTTRSAISHTMEIDNQYQYRYHGDMLVVTAGIPFSAGFSQSNLYVGEHTNFNTAAYTQVEYNYKFLELQGGVRYELAGVDTQIIKTRPVFRSGINIQAAKATWFRASLGQGFRIPSVAEKYLADNFTSGAVIIPNDTLKEESSWSLELGFRQGFLIAKSWKLFFDAAAFWSQYSNYIEYIVGFYANDNGHGDTILPRSYEFPLYPGSHVLLGPKPFNVQNARDAGYELSLTSDGNIGPVGVKINAGYTYDYPATVNPDTGGPYKVGAYIHDLFKYNFQKVSVADTPKLIPLSIRHLMHADVELRFWKMYLGTTLSYYSVPDAVPSLFRIVSGLIFGNPYEVDNYYQQHKRGDFVVDLRTGIKFNEHFAMGFIIKNVANRFYELRPGLAEPIRNYTLQFRYSF
jgi:outer membrane receptor protein involved in Fe transport